MANPSTKHWPRALLLLPALLGCDIVQGFQDAGDTLFPEQSTHLSSPALRLVSGGYRRLDLAAGRELSVLARSTESDTSLFVMRFANPVPCEIPEVGRYVASRNPNRIEAGIAYFHDNATQGTLHFADTSCKTFDLTLEDARMPVGETDRSVIVWAGGTLLEVAPDQGQDGVKTLATEVNNIVTRGFSGRTFVLTAGRIEVFDSEWKSQGRFGKDVAGLIRTGQGVLYLDATGLRRLSAGATNDSTADELLYADACNLSLRGDTWATFQSPCAGGPLHALREPSGEVYDLDVDADPLNFLLFPARDSPGNDPTKDPFWFVFLRDTANTSAFVVRDPQGREHVIGTNATLSYFDLNDSTDEPYGYALLNMADGVGDYTYYDLQGKTHTLAQRTYPRGDRLLVDWDGNTGSLASVSGDRLAIIAEGVPERAFEFTDTSKQWTVLFHDYNGEKGRLSRFIGNLDALGRTPAGSAFGAPELEEIAPSVGIFTTASLGTLIPGASFLADYDTEKGTGRLTYENAELRFKAVVDNGVSDYLITSDYLLYTIPEGRDAGIWLATGK